MTRNSITRRAALLGVGGLALSGCDQLSQNQTFKKMLESAENLSLGGQRLVLNSSAPLAREYQPSDISPDFKANGTVKPDSADYSRLAMTQFADWQLKIDGLVKKPLSLSLEEIKAMPSRTQITRHDCVEGWSAIGQWTGVQLGHVLKEAELAPEARYVVFYCIDELVRTPDRSGFYYESLDLFDALHPQTILAYGMNGNPLPVRHGAPLRLRVERQIGYKHAKFVTRIEAVERLNRLGRGKGGFWEDRGYQWYAGL
jgi:DMSO/TMAO reductase YedYZ molybdopterin-dependent catalytic subunit